MPLDGVIAEATRGPIRAVLDANGPALALFSQREANTAVREALESGGDLWIQVFLPKRFSDYAYKLGYRVSAGTAKAKALLQGKAVPFVGPTHELVDGIGGAWCKATATGAKGTIYIKIPRPHALRPEFARVFSTVPEWEIRRIAKQVEWALTGILNGSVRVTDRKGREVARLVGPRTAPRRSPNRVPARSSSARAAARSGRRSA